MMEDILIVVIVAILVGLAIGYIVKARKKGVKCIGCPDGGKCGSGETGGCSGNCGGCGGCYTDIK